MKHDAIAVIDFGGQYAHLIATKVRRLKVLAEIRQPDDPLDDFQDYQGLIISGSPSLSSFGEDSQYNKAIYDLPIPILGFCFGHQEIAKHYGGTVVHGGSEWGRTRLNICAETPLFRGLESGEQVWMSHFDTVTGIGPDFIEIGTSCLGPEGEVHRFAAIASEKLRRYGVQFHPEVDDTLKGETIISNFLFDICGCRPTWTMDNYLESQVRLIRDRVGEASVFLLISGGVDSAVAAKLLEKALGPGRLRLLHIDNGFMRKNESREVLETLRAAGLGTDLHFADASEAFLSAAAGLIDPEAKRRAVGETFVRVFESEARKLGIEDHLLGQGTIYPDTIETGGTKRADTIKTHHNRVPVIDEMIARGRVVEPLADLYKVEVRELGELLGLPRAVVWKHPFPGPGLAVRLLCSDGTSDRTDFERIEPAVFRIADHYSLEASILPIRSVGVKADLRVYEHPVILSGEADWETWLEVAGRIFREVKGINRCLWNLGPGVPASFEPLAATLTRPRLDLLREADAAVMDGLRRHGVYDDIWQCPTVFVPLSVDGTGRELVVVRPLHSERAMTAAPARLPDALLDELRAAILKLPDISALCLDISSKPPGTIEWE
ncbi:MAG: glutamine-hydrolyzing GMP synthase [Acidobacteriota bacterium]|nr:glutamine-hydrolyzing GMP synthase [Acidobacteriota bacterium]